MALLRDVEVDSKEDELLEEIRESRKTCGCSCGVCTKKSCSCAKAGIPCLVDSTACSCRGACRNPAGRNSFNKQAVKKHEGSTLLRERLSSLSIREMAELIGDGDKSVRTAALNALTETYFQEREGLYKMVGSLPEKVGVSSKEEGMSG